MIKYVGFLLVLLLTGCISNPPKDTCADRPIFKTYVIDVPKRPVLQEVTNESSDGLVVRTSIINQLLLIEYSEKLENLLRSMPSDLYTK